MPEMKPVQSSAILEAGYDSETRVMQVRVRNGRILAPPKPVVKVGLDTADEVRRSGSPRNSVA